MDHDLFDPPSSVDAALEEIERLKVLLKAINDELGNKIIRESMPLRKRYILRTSPTPC